MKFGILSLALVFAVTGNVRAAEGDAAFAVSPESAWSLIDGAIRDAKESISLNIYMLTNRNVGDALAAKANSGVQVTVLLEGQTFGGDILLPVKKSLDDFAAKFKGKFHVMTSQAGGKRRFVFDHAKYMVIDGKKVFVSSENITGSAFGNRNLTGGTRGWEIVLENAAVARQLGEIFAGDSSLSHGDVLPYSDVKWKVKDPGNGPLPPRKEREVPSFAMERGRASAASLCASPRSLECMLDFIRSAKSELAVEHLSLPKVWVNREGGPSKPNPIVEELLAAAKRGVKVRVLLNDDSSFGEGGNAEEKNDLTVAYLKAQATRAKLPLEAALFNFKAVEVNYVHNKGMVADGSRVFVGSINGTENAVMNNREIAVAVTSSDAARFYGKVFDTDWNLSK